MESNFAYALYMIIFFLQLFFWSCFVLYVRQKLSEIRRTLEAIQQQTMRPQAAESGQVRDFNGENIHIELTKSQVLTTGTATDTENRIYHEGQGGPNYPPSYGELYRV